MERRQKSRKDEPFFNSCNTKPTQTTKPENEKIEALSKYFKFVSVLGAGINGITISLLGNDNRYYAVKFMLFSKDVVNETNVVCAINDLRKDCYIFNETYGWLVCDRIPDIWVNYMLSHKYDTDPEVLNHIKKKKKFMVVFMEQNQFGFKNIDLTIRDWVKALFLLLQGFAVARKKFPNFRHRDIHDGNIMFQLETGSVPLYVGLEPDLRKSVPQVRFKISNCTRIPKLIDFGYSQLNQNVWKEDDEDEWSKSFFDAENNRFKARKDLFRIQQLFIKYSRSSNLKRFLTSDAFLPLLNSEATYKDIERVLENAFFRQYGIYDADENIPIEEQPDPIEPGYFSWLWEAFKLTNQQCLVCSKIARMQSKTDKEHIFCGQECANVFYY